LSSKLFSNVRDQTSLQPVDWRGLLHHAEYQTKGQTLMLSPKRYLGLAPMATEPGDHIFVLDGLLEPAILRPQEDGAYTFIGVAYVHEIMQKEWQADFELGVFRKGRVSIR
jgi:hypothetical protein